MKLIVINVKDKQYDFSHMLNMCLHKLKTAM